MHVLIQRTMSVNRHMVRALGWAFSYFFALLCSYYIITHPHVTCVIPATSKVKQITDNMAAGVGRLPGADLRRTHGRACHLPLKG